MLSALLLSLGTRVSPLFPHGPYSKSLNSPCMPLRVPHPYKVWLESSLYFPIENKCTLGLHPEYTKFVIRAQLSRSTTKRANL
ncbi:hypothetical protein BC629DRAFT_1563407 [Irpex lacteus]|nr:hypothetical protein BC629DRAFT_1563407 [Irpex lacteus]